VSDLPDTPAVLLNYADPIRPSFRRLTWRLFLLAWAAFTLYLAYDRMWPWLRVQAPMLLEQRRCLRFTEPKDRVVFDSDPSRVAGLMKLAGYRVAAARTAAVSTVADDCLAAFDDGQGQAAKLDELRNFRPDTGGGSAFWGGGGGLFGRGPDAEAVVFLHRLNAGGPDRLVVIQSSWYAPPGDPGSERAELSATVVVPASCMGKPEILAGLPTQSCKLWAPASGQHMRIFAGQADPADPSRFTIDYQASDGRGTIEGRLRSDDTVEMKIASGPAPSVLPDGPALDGGITSAPSNPHPDQGPANDSSGVADLPTETKAAAGLTTLPSTEPR
jgi:hypothetical protein